MKQTAFILALLTLLFNLTACAPQKDADTVPTIAEAVTLSADETLRETLADTYGFPFRLWGPEGMELYQVIIFEDHAERLWCSDVEREEYTDLEWHISDGMLCLDGAWTESFALDLDSETAASVEYGREYRIVPGLSQ